MKVRVERAGEVIWTGTDVMDGVTVTKALGGTMIVSEMSDIGLIAEDMPVGTMKVWKNPKWAGVPQGRGWSRKNDG